MSLRRLAVNTLQDSLLLLTPRRSLARVGRFLSNTARLDLANEIDNNGERLVQRTVISSAPSTRPLTIFDVGANQGDWTNPLLDCCNEFQCKNLALYCFEPVASTMAILKRNTVRPPFAPSIHYVQCALSHQCGQAQIAVPEDGSGISALTPDPAFHHTRLETVDLLTVDEFADRNQLAAIDLIKIDAEGHDLSVIRGAAGMMKRQAVGIIQFEYNQRWVWSHAFLFDAFQIADDNSYQVGKVTRRGIEVYPRWHPELEKFVEGNYLLCTKQWLHRFPTFPWWNS